MKDLKNERLVTDELVLNKIYFIREQKSDVGRRFSGVIRGFDKTFKRAGFKE